MTPILHAAIASCIALTGAVAAVSPASAVTADIGQCFLLTDEQMAAGGLPNAAAITCDTPHNAEVVLAGTVPAGKDAATWARTQCSTPAVGAALGANRPSAGVVIDPILFSLINFTADGAWQCLVGFVDLTGAAPDGTQAGTHQVISETLATSLANPAAHRTCLISPGKVPTSPMTSGPCSTPGLWTVRGYMLSRHTGAYPGAGALRAEAKKRCPSRTTSYGTDTRKSWNADPVHLIYCFART